MEDIFESPNFDDFKDYVMNFWRPNTEAMVVTTEGATIYSMLTEWFSFIDKEADFIYPDDLKINIGPYIGVHPYAKHLLSDTTHAGEAKYEFLFMYDEIDNTKLTKGQLTFGRDDFVDVFQPAMDNKPVTSNRPSLTESLLTPDKNTIFKGVLDIG